MSEQQLDDLLAAAVGQAFDLSQGVADTLWVEFVGRRAQERIAWAGFAAALVRASAKLRQTVSRPAWPASLAAGLAWR